jgi:hypothetical protein
MNVALNIREQENLRAIGGMRNPQAAVKRLPGARTQGRAVQELLQKAQKLWPQLQSPVKAILKGDQPGELPSQVVDNIRRVQLGSLWCTNPRPDRTATARTPLKSEVIAGWKCDPDSKTLADWLDHGAPMGFDHPIQNTGIFPAVEKRAAETEAQQVQAKTLEGWKNYSSAEEENQELQKLVN